VFSDLKKDVLDAIEDINDLLTLYEPLLLRLEQNEPDIIELAALGTVLHSFYNGIEGIFLLVSKKIDNETPNNPAWHQALLNQMMAVTEARTCLISPDVASVLAPYLKFRHFFRHAYAFMLDWNRLKPLVGDLKSVWDAVREDIIGFCVSITEN